LQEPNFAYLFAKALNIVKRTVKWKVIKFEKSVKNKKSGIKEEENAGV